jgi:aspartate/methionine/tyrosine aminotransferase
MPPAAQDHGARLVQRLYDSLRGEAYPFHRGDGWRPPPAEALAELRDPERHGGLHRYAPVEGHPRLLEAAARHLGVPRERVLVTAGGTGGCSALACALLSEGEEVLVLTPRWPLISGIVQQHHGVPVEVPFYDREGSVEQRLAPCITPRTVAIYLNNPSNPTGRVLPSRDLEAIAAFARTHELWIWSDEVYEDFVYEGRFSPMRVLAPERTFTVQSLSKSRGMAGYRCGMLLTPEAEGVHGALVAASRHLTYAAPTASQIAAAAALEGGDDWLRATREEYRRVGGQVAATLGLTAPEGGVFLFLDISGSLDDRGPGAMERFLMRCFARNIAVTPGACCGAGYERHIRLSFISAPPEVVGRGAAALAALLEEGTR